MGRRPKKPEDKRTEQVCLNLTPAEYQELRDFADKEHRSMGALCRYATWLYMRRD